MSHLDRVTEVGQLINKAGGGGRRVMITEQTSTDLSVSQQRFAVSTETQTVI